MQQGLHRGGQERFAVVRRQSQGETRTRAGRGHAKVSFGIMAAAPGWRVPAHCHDLVAPLPEALAPYVPQFRYDLHDISARGNAEIKGEVLTRLVQLALRHIYSDQPRERLRELVVSITPSTSPPRSRSWNRSCATMSRAPVALTSRTCGRCCKRAKRENR